MKDTREISVCSHLKLICCFVTTTFLLSSSAAFAESLDLIPVSLASYTSTIKVQKIASAHPNLGVDSDGNVMIQYGNKSVTFIYTPPDGSQDLRDRIGSTPCPNCSGFGGITVKLAMSF